MCASLMMVSVTMGLIRRNMLANFAGQGWIALMGFAFVPFYLKFIGAEGYGLIGFFVVLSSSLAILDAGLSATAIREIAGFNDASAEERRGIVSLLTTIEVFFWGIAILVGVGLVCAAPLIAEYWLTVEPDKLQATVKGLRLMGGALAIQFPMVFYTGCLVGLQRQLIVNVVGALSATFRGLGAVAVLYWIAPTVEMFFAWQCIVGGGTLLCLRLSLRREFSSGGGVKKFSVSSIVKVRKFAVGVGSVNVLAFLLTQIDKIVLSKILPIKEFGYYMLAWTLGTICLRLVGPVFNAYYPRVTQLVGLDDERELKLTYLKASRIMGVLVAPLSMWLIFYSQPLLLLWTHDPVLANSTAVALMLIAAGTMLNAFMHMPYALQLANGWTKLAFWQNFLAVLFVLPSTYFFAKRYGLMGAALPWVILNFCYVAISAPIMYRRFIGSVQRAWYWHGIVFPVVFSLVVICFFYYVFFDIKGLMFSIISMISCLLASVFGCFYFFIWRARFR
ncbi:lipopolysaccharide biosynthesis protein [Pseudomonas gingeri]|uniref:lipopolysaccharide biosynthesis protein n=1 Tax=Pseudomonas gingeri TaxID=117681 RepID=UPI0015A336D6|nr:oligosaccharide flippase family protein [Pseudomonas gingeri]NWD09302.1 oligosaccharide flippase family protein [Pseudomonas gingeri]NWE32079.1 oligosaccharide flippase family protein [Pseudomonas gingeri]NWE58703.1 oligosaccharide flippase family protein [Pseudomonas gingeri]NWF01246.1 oligosaccharide flippase family protein [Pseudomonas gingeri]